MVREQEARRMGEHGDCILMDTEVPPARAEPGQNP